MHIVEMRDAEERRQDDSDQATLFMRMDDVVTLG
jgi:hypothetical protein